MEGDTQEVKQARFDRVMQLMHQVGSSEHACYVRICLSNTLSCVLRIGREWTLRIVVCILPVASSNHTI